MFLFNSVKEVCDRNGYVYKLWQDAERTTEHFPITYAYQEDSLKIGREGGQNRFAQVADLCRLELVYTYGGIYLDSNFLIKDDLLRELEKMNICSNKTFIGAHEDPCGLDCANNAGMKYLSNSFFAATKKNAILSNLLDYDMLDQIDLESSALNKTTGPYYLRSGIHPENENTVGLFNDTQIYPFPMSGSVLREHIDNYCLDRQNTGDSVLFSQGQYLLKNCLDIIPENALAVYLVGLGGSWST